MVPVSCATMIHIGLFSSKSSKHLVLWPKEMAVTEISDKSTDNLSCNFVCPIRLHIYCNEKYIKVITYGSGNIFFILFIYQKSFGGLKMFYCLPRQLFYINKISINLMCILNLVSGEKNVWPAFSLAILDQKRWQLKLIKRRSRCINDLCNHDNLPIQHFLKK